MWLSRGKKILKVVILVNTNNEYKLIFEELHPQLRKAEYIRLILCYLAKNLYNFGSEGISATTEISKEISFMQREDINKNTDVIKKADISNLVKIVDTIDRNQCQIYTIELIFHSTLSQAVITKFPLGAIQQQIVFSIAVLIQSIIPKLDGEELNILTKSLRYMYNAYESGVNFSILKNLMNLPNEAYLSSITSLKEKNMIEKPGTANANKTNEDDLAFSVLPFKRKNPTNIKKKIVIYSCVSWILIGLTVLLAFYYTIQAVNKDGILYTTDIWAFFTEIIFQPYFWIALMLRWRIRINRKMIKNG